MPRIKRYFRHFLPTVRSLTLSGPKGSRRQIIYFIGIFQHLRDLELCDVGFISPGPPGGNLTLVPAFVPPLQGWPRLSFTRVGLLKDMVELFGGIRFRYMRFYDVDGMRFLLNACGKTLQTVVLDPTDPRSEQLSSKVIQALVNNFAAKFSIEDFNLSQNNSLWILQVPMRSPDIASSFFKHVLPTIRSTAFYKIVLIYWAFYFRGIRSGHSAQPLSPELSQAERAQEVSGHRRRLEVFRETHKVLTSGWNYIRVFGVLWGRGRCEFGGRGYS